MKNLNLLLILTLLFEMSFLQAQITHVAEGVPLISPDESDVAEIKSRRVTHHVHSSHSQPLITSQYKTGHHVITSVE